MSFTKSEYDLMLGCEALTSHHADLMALSLTLVENALDADKITEAQADSLEAKFKKGHDIISELESLDAIDHNTVADLIEGQAIDDAYDRAQDD